MAHGPLICRECLTETDVKRVAEQSEPGMVCPNCGSGAFGI